MTPSRSEAEAPRGLGFFTFSTRSSPSLYAIFTFGRHMGLLIGVDEAGFGPNLGPLVVAATAWETPGDPREFDPWAAFDGCVSRTADRTGRTIHVADSKVVHAASADVAALERSAAAVLRLAGRQASSLFALWDGLTATDERRFCGEPWFVGDDLGLPLAEAAPAATEAEAAWSERCAAVGCRPVAVAAAVVPSAAFNRAVREAGSKGRVLSRTTFGLVRRVAEAAGGDRALVLCDKHGGRDRYADLLAEAFPESFPVGLDESRTRSRYRVGSIEVRLQVGAEEHLPVAAASLVAKYLREASMEAFNRFWLARRPGLRPTKGYPSDAKRFLAEIEADAAALGLDRDVYWRCR